MSLLTGKALRARDGNLDAGQTLGELRGSRLLLYAVVAFFVVAVVWADRAILDEVTVGQGKVVPSGQIQSIQNLEGGILAQLQVHEGDVVEKGQTLLRIDDTKFASTYREGRSRYLALLAANARLLAQATGKRPEFPNTVVKEAPDLVKGEMALFESQVRSVEVSMASVQRSYQLAKEELDKIMPLLQRGAISEVEILRTQRQVNELRGQIDDKRNKFRAESQAELNKNQIEIGGLEETNISSADRVARTTVRSPVRGIVKKINVVTIGGIIQPGGAIMDIVPLEDNLLIEAQVRPSDIAFLHPGQEAMVKVAAYDFSIFGGLKGKLEHISADTWTDERKGDAYYVIRLRTDQSLLVYGEKQLPIIPGMTVTVEILTGKKSVLDYLLKPFFKAKEKALRER